MHKYQLIEKGDCIHVDISWGKDSMALMETLAGRLNYHPLKFKLAGTLSGMDSQSNAIDIDYRSSFTEDFQAPFNRKLIRTDKSGSHNNSTYFKCSWNPRKTLFQVAQESCFNKLALGQPMDDAIETWQMNMTLQSGKRSMPPALPLVENKMSIIRQLSLFTEEKVKEYATNNNYNREIKELINQLEQLIPKVRSNIYASTTNTQSEYLSKEKE